jgi:CRISPR/Cas system-associated protein Cas10 (large subunit of type III CRISPR-Cas system)
MEDITTVDMLNEHLSHIGAKNEFTLVDILNERLSRIRTIADTTEELRNSPNELQTEIVEELMRVIVLEVEGAKQDLGTWKG